MPILNADKTKHTLILFDGDSDFSKHPDFKKCTKLKPISLMAFLTPYLLRMNLLFLELMTGASVNQFRGLRLVVSISMQFETGDQCENPGGPFPGIILTRVIIIDPQNQ